MINGIINSEMIQGLLISKDQISGHLGSMDLVLKTGEYQFFRFCFENQTSKEVVGTSDGFFYVYNFASQIDDYVFNLHCIDIKFPYYSEEGLLLKRINPEPPIGVNK